MKKTYKNPELEVIKIQTQQMLANSIPTGTYTGGDVDSRENEGYEW